MGTALDITHDKRVRYAPEFGVFIVDMGTMTYTGGASDLLAKAMHYAREQGEMSECVCFPKHSHARRGMALGVEATPPNVHKVWQHGSFVIYGHGTVPEETGAGADAAALNAAMCPLANGEGERQAAKLAKAAPAELYAATVPFPALPPVLAPVALTDEAPPAWEGEPVSFGRYNVPARHVHPVTRAAMQRLAALVADVDALDKKAREAAQLAQDAPDEARREVARRAAAGERVDPLTVTALVRERQDAADAAKTVAAGSRDALDTVRERITVDMREHRGEWLSYLHAHAAYGLARLDALADGLADVLADLADVDRVRQTIEGTRPGALFTASSSLDMGSAVASVREVREQAAGSLGSLSRHAARVADKAPAAG